MAGDDFADDVAPPFKSDFATQFREMASRHGIDEVAATERAPVQAIGSVQDDFVRPRIVAGAQSCAEQHLTVSLRSTRNG